MYNNIDSMGNEAKTIIYKVYLFCAIEAATYKSEDGYFQKFHQRTASATGINKSFLTALLKERGIPATFNEKLDDTIQKKLEATIAQEQRNNTSSGQSLEIGKLHKDPKKWPPFIKVDVVPQNKSAAPAKPDIPKAQKVSEVIDINDKNTKRIIKIRRLGKREAKRIKESQKIGDKSKQPIRVRKVQGIDKNVDKIKLTAHKASLELSKSQTKDGNSLLKTAVKPKSTKVDGNILKDKPLMVKDAIPKTINSTQTETSNSSLKILQLHSKDGTLLVKAASHASNPNTNTKGAKSKSIKLSQIVPTGGNIILKAALPQTVDSVKNTFQPQSMKPSGNISKDKSLLLPTSSDKTAIANYRSASNPIKLNQIRSKDGRIIVTVSNESQIVLVKNDQHFQMPPPMHQQSFIDPKTIQDTVMYSAVHLNRKEENEYIIPDIDPLKICGSSVASVPDLRHTVPKPIQEPMIKKEEMIDIEESFL